jgi:hypothetical protein
MIHFDPLLGSSEGVGSAGLKVSHSMHHPKPSQLRRMHFEPLSGGCVGIRVDVGVAVGEGSSQINPNQADEVQEGLVVGVDILVELGITGGDVIGCEWVWVVLSS